MQGRSRGFLDREATLVFCFCFGFPVSTVLLVFRFAFDTGHVHLRFSHPPSLGLVSLYIVVD